ncbi:MAG: class I SAM-dependent methyltransferase [Synergistaceae bacterium]|nr:class I SAM-dependent methyltransferase [Synergistaceae bacterium]
MEIYERFAEVYDACMQDAPYGLWAEQIEAIWNKHSFKPELVLELGCGTGNMTYRFAERGFDMIAVDISDAMLSVAAGKFPRLKGRIQFIRQDMRELELYGTADAAYSVFDCVNYVTEDGGLLKVFMSVYNYLNPGGLFVFDANTEKKYARFAADGPRCFDSDKFSYIWDNAYNEDTKINECEAVFFIRDEKTGTYEKFTEYHYQRAYSRGEIKKTALAAGFEFTGSLDASTMKYAGGKSERIYYILKKI